MGEAQTDTLLSGASRDVRAAFSVRWVQRGYRRGGASERGALCHTN